jgi:hypothetical protein
MFQWAATGGSICEIEYGKARWVLPTEPGFYQARIVTELGQDGAAG